MPGDPCQFRAGDGLLPDDLHSPLPHTNHRHTTMVRKKWRHLLSWTPESSDGEKLSTTYLNNYLQLVGTCIILSVSQGGKQHE